MTTPAFRGDRLKQARKDAGFRSQQALGDVVGLSQQAIGDLETGKSMETAKLYEIARACGVSPDWLLGKSDDSSTPSSTVVQLRRPIEPRNLPEIDIRGGAAYGGGVVDSEWNEGGVGGHEAIAHWGLPPAYVERELGLTFGEADIIQVRGDSMFDGTATSLSSGDRVIVDRRDTDPRQGGIFVVFDGEGVIIKQVELVRGHRPPRIICKSKNVAYDPIPLTLDGIVRIIGRVAGKISRL